MPPLQEEGPAQEPAQPSPGIDLEELAKIIFELLKRELWLENERTGR